MSLERVATAVATGIELLAVGLLVGGILLALWIGASRARGGVDAFRAVRQALGRTILLTLELLVGADIVRTLALDDSFDSLLALGAIVLIRTFLSFALEVELEGRWPWRRADHP